MITTRLPLEDQVFIHRTLNKAASHHGGMPQMLSMPLQFEEIDGLVQFLYPDWMNQIRGYLDNKYGNTQSLSMMQDILYELTVHPTSAHF